MSRIFLLSSNTMIEPYPVYPLGMAIVASALASAGHTVVQFDFLAEGKSLVRLQMAVKEFNPDYVGVSLRNIDTVDSFDPSNTWHLKKDQELIKVLRQATSAPIILGGAAFSIMPEEILDYLGADFGIAGEGEFLVANLIKDLSANAPVPKILKNTRHPIAGEGLPSPLWKKTLVDFYFRQSRMVSIQTKRGCPYQCAYCTYPNIEGVQLRHRPSKEVVRDIEALKTNYGVDTIFFTDSVFNDHEGGYLDLAEELLRQKVEIRWSGFFHPVNLFDKELSFLKRAGLYAVETGIDATSDITLKELGKNFCFEDVYRFNNACVKTKIPCAHYIIFGGPGETIATVREGLQNMGTLEKCVIFAFSGIRIFPKTALQARAIKEGILTKETSLLKPVYYFSPHIDSVTMNDEIEKAFRGRRDRIFPLSKGMLKLKTLNRLGYHGLLWDKLINFQ